ncbi:hypothetical protein TRFO_24691 [Tritrichomonas foetus]|uniref:Phosphoprotein phosphatase n=1 Tax=Tritrichomonas foetus TaxID=1144522 RepID=A0A1J4K6R2_9EUKA|nr:hypothetical protein TRFO_24691 [Tritrichomonas foetus]|eukprot:OHT07047.1 hypothetical protein TRFO_24691 [Tritrichomonas foetus]
MDQKKKFNFLLRKLIDNKKSRKKSLKKIISLRKSYEIKISRRIKMEEEAISLSQIAKVAYNHRSGKIKAPQSELQELSSTSTVFSSCIFSDGETLFFEAKPSLLTLDDADISSRFQKRARQLCQLCNFSSDQIHVDEKMVKAAMINDFSLACANTIFVSKLNENDYKALYRAFRKNVIRTTPLPPAEWFAPVSLDFTTNKIQESAWPHISLFYDLMYHFLTNRQFKCEFCKDETLKIVRKLPPLFNCPDAREREKLKNIFFLFYRNFPFHRNDFRSAIANYVYSSVECGFIGIADLLSIFIPIFTSLSVESAQQEFISAILPFHKVPYLHHFFPTLYVIATTVVASLPHLTPLLFDYLLSIWPQTSPQKTILFLTEIEGIISLSPKEIVAQIIMPITLVMRRSILDANLSVVERTFVLWECEKLRDLLIENAVSTFPILLPPTLKVANSHWSSDLQSLANSVLQLMQTTKPEYFSQCKKDIFFDVGKKKGMVWHEFVSYAKNMSPQEKDKARNDILQYFPECKVSKDLPALSLNMTSLSTTQVKPLKPKIIKSGQHKPKVPSVGSYKPKHGEPILPNVNKKNLGNLIGSGLTSIKKPCQVPRIHSRPR